MCSSVMLSSTGRSARGGRTSRRVARASAKSASVPRAARSATAHSGGTVWRITLLIGQVRPHANTTVTSSTAPSHRAGAVLLVTVVFAWGLTWPINKVILQTVPPLWAVALRAALGTLALFALALATRRLVRPPRADLPVLLSITLLHMVGFTTLSTAGLALVPAGRSAVLA